MDDTTLTRFRVDEASAGRRLDEFLAARLHHLSRMKIETLLTRGACAVNAVVRHAGHRLAAGDAIEVALTNGREPNSMTPEALPLDIVHEDADLLVVVKPAGMLVHPTRGVKTGTLANALAHHFNQSRSADFIRPGIVHRLDRATSGLMVVAKTQRSLSILSRHFHHRLVEKRYLALVRGVVAADEMIIEAPIGRDPEASAQPFWKVLETGRHAETRLRVIERRSATTLVELEPVTGRTNQLRIHCAHIGHPIAGDEWYGGDAHARLCLHAARLGFHHPSGGDWTEFASPAPEEMLKIDE